MVLSGIAAVLVFIGVSSYVASVNSRVGPMVTVYRVTTDLPAFTTLSSENTEPAEVPERWAADNTMLRSADIDGRVIATPMTAGSPVAPTDEVYVAGTSPALLHRHLGGAVVRVAPIELEPHQPYATKSAMPLTVLAGTHLPRGSEPPCPSCDARLVAGGCLFCGHAVSAARSHQVLEMVDHG